MNRLILSVMLLLCVSIAGNVPMRAQNVFEQTVSFDRIVYDFGDILLSDGPLDCSFTMKNISDRPVVIHRVVTSCGCTEPTWTEAPIRPGETGEIKVVFTNRFGRKYSQTIVNEGRRPAITDYDIKQKKPVNAGTRPYKKY